MCFFLRIGLLNLIVFGFWYLGLFRNCVIYKRRCFFSFFYSVVLFFVLVLKEYVFDCVFVCEIVVNFFERNCERILLFFVVIRVFYILNWKVVIEINFLEVVGIYGF